MFYDFITHSRNHLNFSTLLTGQQARKLWGRWWFDEEGKGKRFNRRHRYENVI